MLNGSTNFDERECVYSSGLKTFEILNSAELPTHC